MFLALASGGESKTDTYTSTSMEAYLYPLAVWFIPFVFSLLPFRSYLCCIRLVNLPLYKSKLLRALHSCNLGGNASDKQGVRSLSTSVSIALYPESPSKLSVV